MIQVVGFEGGGPDAPATYGVVAFRHDDLLVNPVTGTVSRFDEYWDELVQEGHVTAVGPLDLPESKSYLKEKPCVLLRTGFDEPSVLRGLTAMASHVWKAGGTNYFLFSSVENLAKAARPAVQNLLRSRDPACIQAARILKLSYDQSVP